MQWNLDGTELLRNDHKKIMDLFTKFDSTASTSEKEEVVNTLTLELKLHAVLEEEYLYPILRSSSVPKPHIVKGLENHREMKVMTRQLQRMCGDEPNYIGLVHDLKTFVEKHFQLEERKIFHKISDSGTSVEELKNLLTLRREELLGRRSTSNFNGERVE